MIRLQTCAKALVAGLTTAIAAAIPLSTNGLTFTESLITAGAFLAGAFPTWAVKNKNA